MASQKRSSSQYHHHSHSTTEAGNRGRTTTSDETHQPHQPKPDHGHRRRDHDRGGAYEIEVIDLCYDVMRGGERVRILEGVSLKARPGEVVAVAGPSGCGKSTLLGLVAGARPMPAGVDAGGAIRVNGGAAGFTLRRAAGYVPQADALLPQLTVRETLVFGASVRSRWSGAERAARVEALMEELGLAHVGDRRVGDAAESSGSRGLSGGERRRVSIGAELAHDPPVLVLDEPTSGLDSASALSLVFTLRGLAARPRTVVLSIHQPSSRIVGLFSSLLLLATGGRVVHHGSLAQLRHKLADAGHRVHPQLDVLEYAIDAITRPSTIVPPHACHRQRCHSDATTTTTTTMTATEESMEATTKQRLKTCMQKVVKVKGSGTTAASWFSPALDSSFEYSNACAAEVALLAQRFARNTFRASELFTQRALQSLGAGIALGTIYMNISSNNNNNNNTGGTGSEADRLGFFAFTLTFLFSSSMEALPIYLRERDIVETEMRRGAYRVSSYALANVCVFLPFLFLLSLLYALGAYWLVGANGPVPLARNPDSFAFFVLVLWLALALANSFLSFIVTLVPDFVVGNSVVATCFAFFFLFSGYFIASADMPAYWRFMHYASLFKYPLDALLVNEFGSSDGRGVRCFDAIADHGSFCILTGDTVLTALGLHDTSKWASVGVMISFACLYRLLSYFTLLFKVCQPTSCL